MATPGVRRLTAPRTRRSRAWSRSSRSTRGPTRREASSRAATRTLRGRPGCSVRWRRKRRRSTSRSTRSRRNEFFESTYEGASASSGGARSWVAPATTLTPHLAPRCARQCMGIKTLALARARSATLARSLARSRSRSRSRTRARSRSCSRAVLVGRRSRTSDRRRPRRVRVEVGRSSLSLVSRRLTAHKGVRLGGVGRVGGRGWGGVHFDHAPVNGALSNEMHLHPSCCCSGAGEHSRG